MVNVSLSKFAKVIGDFAKSHGSCEVVSVGTGFKDGIWSYVVNVAFEDGTKEEIRVDCYEVKNKQKN